MTNFLPPHPKARLEVAPPDRVFAALDSGERIALHPLWLRERTTAADAFDERSRQRLFEPHEMDEELAITAAAAAADGAVDVQFSDGHRCRYLPSDLELEIYAESDPALPAAAAWRADEIEIPRFDYAALRAGKTAAAEMAAAFIRAGFVVGENVPCVEGEIERFANLFGPVRETNFGKIFDVKSKAKDDANDLAYTALALAAHTDNPYRRAAPDVQLLHALQNEAEGGDSTLADGFMIAADLKAADPEGYEALTTTPVVFRFFDRGAELTHRAPLIEIDDAGRPRRVRFSGRLDYAPPTPMLAAYYRARRRFYEMANSPAYRLTFRLRAGELLMMDNARLLHGRAAFAASGARHLQGCYMDVDDIQSAVRVAARDQAAAA